MTSPLIGIKTKSNSEIDSILEAKARELYQAANPIVTWGAVTYSAKSGSSFDSAIVREYRESAALSLSVGGN